MKNDETCKTCFGNACNQKSNFLKCFQSNKNPRNLYGNILPKMCTKYDDKCFVQVIKGNITIRGCVEDFAIQNDLPSNFLSNVENKHSYRICSEPQCNDDNDPEIESDNDDRDNPNDRLKCYQCTPGRDCNLMHTKNNLEATECPNHSKYDNCYTFIDKGRCALFILHSELKFFFSI